MTIAGGMKKIATVQVPVIGRGANGEEIKTWTFVAKRFVMVSNRGGQETEQSNIRVQSTTLYEIHMRYEKVLAGMTPEWRLVINNLPYDIASVENIGLENRRLKIMARAYAQ